MKRLVQPKTSILVTAAATVFVAGAAMGGSPMPYYEEPVPYVPVQPEPLWEGFYAGVIGGFLSGELEPSGGGAIASFDATTYGVMAGYNFQDDHIVYGGELDIQMGNASTSVPAGIANNNPFALDFDIDYLVDLRGRLGYAMDNVLVYAAGGLTAAKISTAGGGFTGSGWNAGAGVDFGLTDDVFLGGEYVYRNLSGEDSIGTPYDLTGHSFQARIGYRF